MEGVVANTNKNAEMCIPCLICGTFVNLTEHEINALYVGKYPVKVCKGCKRAIAFVKEQMKKNDGSKQYED